MSGYLVTIYRTVADNVINKRTVTFRVTEKVTDKYGAEKSD